MGAFEYTALDAGGRERKGILEGDTPRQIRQLLREQQLLPVSVTEVAQKEAKRAALLQLRRGGSRPRTSRCSPASWPPWCAPGCRSRSRCSPSRSRPRSRACRASCSGCARAVMEGHTLADGFAEFPRVFPEIYRATVAAGEQSGHLDNVLERLADYTESREQIRQKVLAAMLYPIVLTVMCFAIVVGPAGVRGAEGGGGVRDRARRSCRSSPAC